MVLPFDLPIEDAPLQVKDAVNVLCFVALYCVPHQDQVDWHYVFHLDSEDTIDPCEH
jgi:hypothetical protein